MIEWSIEAFRACGSLHSLVIAAPPGHVHDLVGDDLTVVPGGATRCQSVTNALLVVETELVAIHDAARPLVTPALLEEVVALLDVDPSAAGAIAAAPVSDTIKRVGATRSASSTEEGTNALFVRETLDRSRLWAAQTPQVFRADALRAALEVDAEARDAATDEAMLIEAVGGTVLIHPAPAENFKVTTPHDLKIAELLLSERLSP